MTAKRKALLIGVKTCPAGDLLGPGNDVAVMRGVVCDRYDFDPEVVPDEDATRGGILDAFDRLVDGAAAGDSLLFYFAGHGTQIEGKVGDEEVLREALCPHDFERDPPRNAILDFELHERFARAQKRGATLTAIFDCCFAGGMPLEDVLRRLAREARTRLGAAGDAVVDLVTGPRARFIAPYGDVLEPLRRAFHRPRRTKRLSSISDVPLTRSAGPPPVVFGACLATQLASERAFGSEIRGVFTHHLSEVLGASGRGMTNLAVRDAVRDAVRNTAGACSEEDEEQEAIAAPPTSDDAIFLF